MTATGYGTLTLPGGKVYSNVMKLHSLTRITNHNGSPTATTNTYISNVYFDVLDRYPVLEVSIAYFPKVGGGITAGYQILVKDPFVVGLSEQGNEDILIYPNPCGDRLHFNIPVNVAGVCTFSFFNWQGQLIKTAEIKMSSGQEAAIQINELPAGIYLVHLRIGEKKYVKKLIVE